MAQKSVKTRVKSQIAQKTSLEHNKNLKLLIFIWKGTVSQQV